MKKFLLVALAALFVISCDKNEIPTQYGSVKLSIDQGASVFVRSGENALPEVGDDYIVSTIDANSYAVEALSGTYGQIKDQQIAIAVGNYTVSAYNITAEKAIENRGAQRFFGSKDLEVKVGELNQVAFTCKMDNARVSFVFDNTFKQLFNVSDSENPAKVVAHAVANSSRTIDYTYESTLAEDDAQIAYFNVDETDATLKFTITAVRKSDSQVKEYTKTITLQKQSWHQITIKAATSQGSADIAIDVDESIATVQHDIQIDPYN